MLDFVTRLLKLCLLNFWVLSLKTFNLQTYKAAEVENKSNDTSAQVSDNVTTLATGNNTYR